MPTMRLFVSYAHVDKFNVDNWLVRNLHDASYDVWTDDRLLAGQDWQNQLADAISKCDALVYAMTPESIASTVCQWEVDTARNLGKPVVPVLMQARTPIPPYLAKTQYVDFSAGPTPGAVAKLLGGLSQLNSTPLALLPGNFPVSPSGKPKTRLPRWLWLIGSLLLIFLIFAVITIMNLPSAGVVGATESPALTATIRPSTEDPTLMAEPALNPSAAFTPLVSVSTPEGTYPCDAFITTKGRATTLRMLKNTPNDSASAVNSVRNGEKIKVLGQPTSPPNAYYEIKKENGDRGWIAVEYVELVGGNCPRS